MFQMTLYYCKMEYIHPHLFYILSYLNPELFLFLISFCLNITINILLSCTVDDVYELTLNCFELSLYLKMAKYIDTFETKTN